jgi:glycosyltransferase involved in cell wall biosynthesis
VRLHGPPEEGHRRVVRAGLRLGDRAYLSFQPEVLRNAAMRMLGRRPRRGGEPAAAERRWLVRQLRRARPDVVILAFGACAFTKMLADGGFAVAALRGFFEECENRLSGPTMCRNRPADARYEELAAADFVAFNNKTDARLYADRTGRPASLVGMGFPPRAQIVQDTMPAVLFVGAATACNVESLHWFLDRCWPTILRHVPNARLDIVGSIVHAIRQARHPNVTLVGPVNDLAGAYAASQVVVAPLVLGSNGVKTKVAKALSCGRPLVTTSLGIEPDDRALLGDGVSTADDPDDFAACVVCLLTDRALRHRHEKGAVAIFERLFSTQVAHASLGGFIRRALAPQIKLRKV